ncbi:hypothetical protein [Azospirillum sp. sgz302134]
MTTATDAVADATGTALDTFVALSVALTGISADSLAPRLDPINLKQAYYDTLVANAGADVTAHLLQQFTTLTAGGLPASAAAASILMQPVLGNLARAVIKMWLLGSWIPPRDAQDNPLGEEHVISDQAYKEGWAWRAAQSHPMGYSMFSYGYWAKEPPSLTNFVPPVTP